MDEYPFTIAFYETATGDSPARAFLQALPKEARRKCGRYMLFLQESGLALPASYLRKLEGSIWELRPEYDGIEYRLLFGHSGKLFVFVHAFIKKRQKTARADIELAQRRFDDWRVRNDGEK
ncbi:MAG: type II toxin-antitoxin system RelE/ParE family toxin [Thermomicrobiales bacterium]